MLPVQVRIHTPSGSVCEEEALMQDVSQGGMSFRTQMILRKGQVVHLSAAVPATMREFDRGKASYRVYGIVRDVLADDEGCRVGVMFFGEHPPKEYERNPAARFLLPGDLEVPAPRREPAAAAAPVPDGKRRHPRYDLLVDVEISYVDEWGNLLDFERTFTENLGMGGARVRTSHHFADGSVVFVRQAHGRFESRAEIVGSFVGPYGVRRLNLRFLDEAAAVDLIKAC